MAPGRPAAPAGGACSPASASRHGARRGPTSVPISSHRRRAGALGLLAHEQRHVGRDLVVARPRRVELAADRPDELGQPALDRHVDVLVAAARTRRSPASSSAATASRPAQQLVGLGLLEDARLGQHRHVRLGLAHVVGRQAPVEADRGVQRWKTGSGGSRKRDMQASLGESAAGCELPVVGDRPDLHDEHRPEQIEAHAPARERAAAARVQAAGPGCGRSTARPAAMPAGRRTSARSRSPRSASQSDVRLEAGREVRKQVAEDPRRDRAGGHEAGEAEHALPAPARQRRRGRPGRRG